MNCWRLFYIFPAFFLSLAAGGCGGPSFSTDSSSNHPYVDLRTELQDGDTIAVFSDGAVMLYGYYRQKLDQSHLVLWGGELDHQVAIDFRDSLLIDTLAGIEAQTLDLERHYSSYRTYQQLYYDFLIRAFWEEEVYTKVSADSTEVIEFYHQNEKLFAVDEQMNLYHILVSPSTFLTGPDSAYYKSLSTDQFRDHVRIYVDNVHKLLDYGEPFENVAFVFSHDAEVQKNSGHVGWTTRGTYVDPFDSIAFSLEPFTYCQPYADNDGWHIVYSGGYIPEGPVPIDSSQVYESARQSLLTQKSNKLSDAIVDSLMRSLELVINESVLDTNIYLINDSIWMGLVNGTDTVDVRYVKRYEEGYRKRYSVRNTTPEMKREMIRESATAFRIVQLARSLQVDKLPKVAEEREKIWHHRTKIITARQAFDPIWEPEETTVKKYYESNLDEFIVKKPLTLEMLTVDDSVFAAFLREQAQTGIDFQTLADEQEELTGIKIRYESLGRVGEKDIPHDVYIAGMNVQVGAISPAFGWDKGYSIVHLQKRKDSKNLIFATGGIKILLKKKHQRQVWEDRRDDVFKRYHVKFPAELPPISLGRRGERLPEPIP